jgi:hypothetical protein
MGNMRGGLCAFVVALTLGFSNFTRPAAAVTDGPGQAELKALTQAYADLAVGNHDYKGHRVKALKEVETACHILGLSIQGDGKAHQQQRTSDERLREAQSLLKDVYAMAEQSHQHGVMNHVDAALKQIAICLTIK